MVFWKVCPGQESGGASCWGGGQVSGGVPRQ